MKIGIFDPYLDDLGGGEKYMMTIAECLSRGNEVSIFWENKGDIKEIEDRFSLDLSKAKITKNIFSSKVSFLSRALSSRKYDAIIVLSDGSIPFLLCKKLFICIQQPISGFKNNSIKDKFKLARVCRIFFNSNFTRSYFGNVITKKRVVLYPPVFLNPKKTARENVILHVGRFRARNIGTEDYKKQGVMIDAFKSMVDKGLPNWKLVLAVGLRDEEKEGFLETKKKAAGYPIEFQINLNNEDLWNLYSKSKIYWHASGYGEDLENHPEYAEHFGISTVEAMGVGVVPVVIRAGGQKEIVEEGKSGFLWNSLEELQEKTLDLIKDEKLLHKLSEAAQERAKFFAGDRFGKEIKALIDE